MEYKYVISCCYCWYNNMSQIVRMYFIEGVPFTFDDIPESYYYDHEVVELAASMGNYDIEALYKASDYLIAEECHPMLFDIKLKNPGLMPTD